MSKKGFKEIFQENPDGSLTPKQRIKIGGVIIGPNTTLQSGVSVGGVIFHNYKYLDIATEENGDGILEIKGIYKE